MNHLKDDPDKWNPFMPGNFLENSTGSALTTHYELLDIQNIVKIGSDPMFNILTYYPGLSHVQRLTGQEVKSFNLVGMRWLSSKEESRYSFRVQSQFVSYLLLSNLLVVSKHEQSYH